jgi:hypothetical protein
MAMNAIYLNPQLLVLGLIFCLIQIREIEVGEFGFFTCLLVECTINLWRSMAMNAIV